MVKLTGEKIASLEFRQHAAYYLKGAPRAAKAKVAINKAQTQQEMNDILDEYVANLIAKGLAC